VFEKIFCRGTRATKSLGLRAQFLRDPRVLVAITEKKIPRLSIVAQHEAFSPRCGDGDNRGKGREANGRRRCAG
jgi:hypothetical protein